MLDSTSRPHALLSLINSSLQIHAEDRELNIKGQCEDFTTHTRVKQTSQSLASVLHMAATKVTREAIRTKAHSTYTRTHCFFRSLCCSNQRSSWGGVAIDQWRKLPKRPSSCSVIGSKMWSYGPVPWVSLFCIKDGSSFTGGALWKLNLVTHTVQLTS